MSWLWGIHRIGLRPIIAARAKGRNAKQPAPAAAIPAIPALSQIRNLGQFHWKDAANINNSSIRAQQSTVAITGSNMAALRNHNLATTECYAFILEPFVNLKPCDYLPTFDVTREGSVKLSELLEIAIACFNSSWEGGSEAGLDWMNNVHIQIGPHFLLHDILQAVLRDCGQNLEKTVPPKFRNRKFAAVYLEAHIDLEKDWGVASPKIVTGSGGSRTLKSAFVLMAPSLPLDPTPVADMTSTSDPMKGLQNFAWTTEKSDCQLGHARKWSHQQRRSKLVFKLTIDGVAYVAKRCYTIGNGSAVSIVDNRDQLIKEGTTLGRTKFFLNSFKKECEHEEIEISEFEVTDFILAREGVDGLTDSFTPSPASGIRQSDYASLPDTEKDELKTTHCPYIFQRGNVQLRKYSGTLDHPRYSDKQGATINAFQHFSYLYSNNTLVLADIQASESHNPLSKASILFDLMSHTLDGTSGAGDHGKEGIKTFVDQHECVQKCTLMGMKALKDLEGEEEDAALNGGNNPD
ncbi:kinase-like domain-containing protein [Mycena olivaceomarginata]|nr:kinase-like domain-containing protein [Mycena olivaceomarginata]